MNAHMEKLEEVLGEELRIYGRLLEACSAATDKVLCCDIDGLAEVTREQNQLIMAAAETERARTGLLAEVLRAKDGSEEAVETGTKSELRFIAEPYAARLAEHGENLRVIVEELRETSKTNRFLLSYSLQAVDRAVRFVCGTPESDGTYEPPGSSPDRQRPNNGLLNKQA